MKAIQEYTIYEWNKGYWFCKQEVFESLNLEVKQKMNKIMSKEEVDKLTKGVWTDVRNSLIKLLDNK